MTVGSFAAVASATALGAAAAIAGRAPAAALVADVTLAAFAGEHFVAVMAAVGAACATPVVQLHIGAAGVVGLQHLPHEQKEVAQAPLLQRLRDRDATIPLAEPFGADMRVSHAAITLGGMFLFRDDAVRHRGIHLPPIEPDLKRA